MKDPELRASELSHTGSPHPYIVDYEALVEEPFDIEQRTHRALSHHNEGKEWFRCTVEDAIVAIQFTAGNSLINENFRRANKARADALRAEKQNEERLIRVQAEESTERQALLSARRAEIHNRYQPQLDEAAKVDGFWSYYLVVFSLLVIGINIIAVKLSEIEMFLFAFFVAFLITPLIRGHNATEGKMSEKYQSALSKMNSELLAAENSIQSCIPKNDTAYSSQSKISTDLNESANTSSAQQGDEQIIECQSCKTKHKTTSHSLICWKCGSVVRVTTL
jgi:hypothetical protein